MTQYPVLLVPGWHDRARRLRRLERYLIRSGWPDHAVHTVDFADRHGSNVVHAAEIADALRMLVARNSADRLDIVAHSMGGLAVRYLLHTRPEAKLIRRAVFLGTPHRGTFAAYLAWGAGGRDMRIGSPFLTELESFNAAVNTELFCIRTPLDLRLIPPGRGTLAGAQNITVWCGSHRLLLHSRRAREVVKGILRTTFALFIASALVGHPQGKRWGPTRVLAWVLETNPCGAAPFLKVHARMENRYAGRYLPHDGAIERRPGPG